MDYMKVTDDLSFSRVIAGMMRASREGLSGHKMTAFVNSCLEMGITTFDHADIYGLGESERLFGEAVLKNNTSLRDKMQLVTKFNIVLPTEKSDFVHYYDSSVQHLRESVDESLKNLCTDYIDVLLIHRLDPLLNPVELAEGLDTLVQEGKVRNIGISNASYTYFDMVNTFTKTPLVTNQVEVSTLYTDTFFNGIMDSALKHDIPVMAWSPLGGGRLFSPKTEQEIRVVKVLETMAQKYQVDSIDKIAYAFILKHPAKICPVTGSMKIERIKACVDALKIPLSTKDWFMILEASRGMEVL
ncbi:aldo/keto reductase [Sporanaerobium hydrogeniformans]|uniref:Aldo/keto reductase n=1 Tax=Sporanaerobium hydrogeniformans TaxID=3072179 RepID=A0AC61DEM8_9FIRM|nr:aldo/keto reductase [Sporanaerobium hydrogeniformans]PHV71619.1 aldo/keto reductase [Sporanaerobium hydrogeniformans]